MPADIGVLGLGVMGSSIALNIADHGYEVAVHNRNWDRTQTLLEQLQADQQITGYENIVDFVAALKAPRTIMLMVTAGVVVDRVIDSLLPHLDQGDIIIDGGNSFYQDTERRWETLKQKGLRFLGIGVSGGEEGARFGPSLMPGGDPQAWPFVKDLFQSIAAKAEDGTPCCQWVGNGGAGHYVKMIHNGIEYGDMQLIAESWHLMHAGLGFQMDELADIYQQWNEGALSSYLIDITAKILRVKDAETPRVLNILDKAGQKGTGRWTAIESLNIGAPLTMITEAVFARVLSSMKEERLTAADRLGSEINSLSGENASLVKDIHDALYAAKIISYTQGFLQMREASAEYGWELDFGNVALLWRAGCIIRSRFLDDIKQAFERDPQLQSLLLDEFFAEAVKSSLQGWRNSVVMAINCGIPVPAMSSALSFYDGYRMKVLPANLLQAQRDFFGAHTYQRVDKPGVFHTHWLDQQQEEQVDG